ncbi:MAG TPA: hypothetical protein VES39_02050, partial [Rhodospirillales bacterium]|nr:hypothetical protein [Rhodospirillales bacterium]
SVVRASGDIVASSDRPLLIGRDEVPDPLAQFFPFLPPLVAAQSGDGGLLRVSNAGSVSVTRRNLPDVTVGGVVLGSGAIVDGGRSLIIDAAGQASIDGNAVVLATAIELASTDLNLLAPDGTPGADIGAAALQAILQRTDSLTLRAARAITFWSPLDLRPAAGGRRLAELTLNTPLIAGSGLAGGTIALDAAKVTLTSDGPAPAGTAVGGDGRLLISGDRLVLTGGDRRIDGFGTVAVVAAQAISVGDGKRAGTLTLPGTLLLDTPLLLAASGATQTIATSGAVVLGDSQGTGVTDAIDEIGGKLVIDAAGIVLDSAIAAPAGVLELRARDGDIVLQEGARLLAPGYTQTFIDKRVMLAGGSVKLRADAGSVVAAPGSLIDVAAAPGGNAGTLTVAVAGAFVPGGTLRGNADPGLSGGGFELNSGSVVDLDTIAAAIGAGGFDRRFAVRSAAGDLALSRGVRAHDVVLAADAGAIGIAPGAVIDASGASGGHIALWGANGVVVSGGASLLAYADPARP